jgi:hypothetical protein
MGTPEAPVALARSFPASTLRPRGQPQAILSAFQHAVDRAENLRRMQIGRPVNGITECVAKLVSAERQKAVHIIAAADRALAELQG